MFVLAGCGKAIAGQAIHVDDSCWQDFSSAVNRCMDPSDIPTCLDEGFMALWDSQDMECQETANDIYNCFADVMQFDPYSSQYSSAVEILPELLQKCPATEDELARAKELRYIYSDLGEDMPPETYDNQDDIFSCIQDVRSYCEGGNEMTELLTCDGDKIKDPMMPDGFNCVAEGAGPCNTRDCSEIDWISCEDYEKIWGTTEYGTCDWDSVVVDPYIPPYPGENESDDVPRNDRGDDVTIPPTPSTPPPAINKSNASPAPTPVPSTSPVASNVLPPPPLPGPIPPAPAVNATNTTGNASNSS